MNRAGKAFLTLSVLALAGYMPLTSAAPRGSSGYNIMNTTDPPPKKQTCIDKCRKNRDNSLRFCNQHYSGDSLNHCKSEVKKAYRICKAGCNKENSTGGFQLHN